MRALVLDHEFNLIRDYPDPQLRPDESIVKVRLAGICGTDLELCRGYMAFRGVPGHEFVGEVIESADRNLLGRRVVGEINAACGRCQPCISGLGLHCPNRTVLGILGRDGCFGEFLSLPDENLLRVPDSIPDESAVFAEPLAAAIAILTRVPIARNQTVAVLGDGRLGAIVAMALKAEDYTALLAGHHPDKLEKLKALGLATELETNLRPGFDVVIDCTGAPSGFVRALELVRPGGKIVLKSTAASGVDTHLAPRLLNQIVVDEICVMGSRCGRLAPALAALEAGRLDLRGLISAVYPLEDGLSAIAAAAEPPNLKIILKLCS